MENNKKDSVEISVIVPLLAGVYGTSVNPEVLAGRALVPWISQTVKPRELFVYADKPVVSAAKELLLNMRCGEAVIIEAEDDTEISVISCLDSVLGSVSGQSVIVAGSSDYYPEDYLEKLASLSMERDIVSAQIHVLFPEHISDFSVFGYDAFKEADLLNPLDELIKNGGFWGWQYLGNKIIKTELLREALEDIEKFSLKAVSTPCYPLINNLFIMLAVCAKAKTICHSAQSAVVFDWNFDDLKIRQMQKEADNPEITALHKIWPYLKRKAMGHNISSGEINAFKEGFLNRFWWRTAWVFPENKRDSVSNAIAMDVESPDFRMSDKMPKSDWVHEISGFEVSLYIYAEEGLEEEPSDLGIATLEGKDTLIASIWDGGSYGNALSTFALFNILKEGGKNPVLLQEPDNIRRESYNTKGGIASKFLSENCDIVKRNISKEELGRCRTFISGPDCVWSSDLCGKNGKYFYFGKDLAKENVKKISFASSFGNPASDRSDAEYIINVKNALKGFAGISVRGKYDVSICQSRFGISSDIVLDPIFLCDGEVYRNFAAAVSRAFENPYILVDLEQNDAWVQRHVKDGAFIKEMACIDYAESHWIKDPENESGIKAVPETGVAGWLSFVAGSDYIISDSYYTICLAIIFRKSFSAVVSNDFRKRDDLEQLLESLGLGERLVNCDGSCDLGDYMYLFRKNIDYRMPDKKLSALKEASLNWLKEKL